MLIGKPFCVCLDSLIEKSGQLRAFDGPNNGYARGIFCSFLRLLPCDRGRFIFQIEASLFPGHVFICYRFNASRIRQRPQDVQPVAYRYRVNPDLWSDGESRKRIRKNIEGPSCWGLQQKAASLRCIHKGFLWINCGMNRTESPHVGMRLILSAYF